MTDHLEVRLLRWSESSQSGRTVTFQLTEDEGEHPFRGLRVGKTGERFAMVLVKIADDEMQADHVFPDGYVDGSKPDKTEGEKAVTRAVMLCKDEDFQFWAWNQQGPTAPMVPAESVARNYILDRCGITSRSELATNIEALEKFKQLETSFRYRGQLR